MSQIKNNHENESLVGYVKLVEQMIINVFDRIRIKKSWHTKILTARMVERKRADVLELSAWLDTDSAKWWFDSYGRCTGKNGDMILNDFRIIARKSKDFLETLDNS
jgi:hypothetical protein